MSEERQHRRMSTLLHYFNPHEQVWNRLQRWVGDGQYGWVFDNPEDRLSFKTSVTGIDITQFLDNPDIRTDVMVYLFHRTKQAVGEGRHAVFNDEFWRSMQDPYFQDKILGITQTGRKEDSIFVAATQSMRVILDNPVLLTIVDAMHTVILFPDPSAKYEEFVTRFGLSEREFYIIKKEILPGSGKFLVKQRGMQSYIGGLDLSQCPDHLAVMSGNLVNAALAESIIAEVGRDPYVFLPIFHQRRRRYEGVRNWNTDTLTRFRPDTA
jgi:type IV secretion system protein VirB4